MRESSTTKTISPACEDPGIHRKARGNYFRTVAAYWEQLYEDKHLTARIYQERKDVTLAWIKEFSLPSGARALDLGCGAGYTAVALARAGLRVNAVDCEEAMLETTSRRAKAAGVPLELGLGDAHELPFEDNTFDVVLALGLIPWLQSPHKAIEEMRRVLKPGGFIVVSSDNSLRFTSWFDPFYNPLLAPCRNLVAAALRKRGWMRMPETTPPMMQSPREFDRWLDHAGFQKIKGATIGFGPFTLFRRKLLPDDFGARLHEFMQRLAYRRWPLFRQGGAHYLVAAANPSTTICEVPQNKSSARQESRPEVMEFKDTSTSVVVLGANTHGSLGIMRSLGRMGVSVHAVCSPPRGPASFSAYCKSSFVWDFAHAKPQETVGFLLNLARWIGRPSILIPTWDEMAVFASEYYEALRPGFIYAQQPAGLPASLCSKKEMAALACSLGVPTPATAFPRSLSDVLEYIETARFPVMLKGIDGNKLKERTGRKMMIVYSPRQLQEMYLTLEDPDAPNLMLQEYIPGGDDSVWMFNGYFNSNSECLLGFTGRKLRQTPIHTGMTSLGICLQNDVVDATTRQFMRALGYRGILDIGYRYDSRDELYKVLDVNPRIGATFRLFVAENGLDVARAMYLDLTGQPVPSSRTREGRKWVVELDLQSCLDYRREGSLSFRQWLRSLRGIEEAGYFAWDDLAPFWRLCVRAARQLLKPKPNDKFAKPATATQALPHPTVTASTRSQAQAITLPEQWPQPPAQPSTLAATEKRPRIA